MYLEPRFGDGVVNLLAQVPVDPVGVIPWTTLAGQLGASLAVVIVVVFGLQFAAKIWDKVDQTLRAIQAGYQDQVMKLEEQRREDNRMQQEESRRQFDQIRAITQTQNEVISRVTAGQVELTSAFRALEKAVDRQERPVRRDDAARP